MNEWKEYSAKTVSDAVALALKNMQTSEDKIIYEVIEKESKGFLGINSKPAKIRVKEKVVTVEEIAEVFLRDVLGAMNIPADIDIKKNESGDTLEVQLIGTDMGLLIGKRGQTLDSLQYLTSLVINKESENYLKVKLDTENYRERRKETLENLANNIAHKIKKTHKAVSLEPMNPYERRIIHSTLQNDKFVDTHSEGDEPYRKVVITPKKGLHYNNYNKFNGGNNYKPYDKKYGNKPYGSKKISNTKDFHKKYGADTKDYSTDYKKDYASYLESKAAAKAEEAKAEANK